MCEVVSQCGQWLIHSLDPTAPGSGKGAWSHSTAAVLDQWLELDLTEQEPRKIINDKEVLLDIHERLFSLKRWEEPEIDTNLACIYYMYIDLPKPMNSISGLLDLRNLTTPTPGESISQETICHQRKKVIIYTHTHTHTHTGTRAYLFRVHLP